MAEEIHKRDAQNDSVAIMSNMPVSRLESARTPSTSVTSRSAKAVAYLHQLKAAKQRVAQVVSQAMKVTQGEAGKETVASHNSKR